MIGNRHEVLSAWSDLFEGAGSQPSGVADNAWKAAYFAVCFLRVVTVTNIKVPHSPILLTFLWRIFFYQLVENIHKERKLNNKASVCAQFKEWL